MLAASKAVEQIVQMAKQLSPIERVRAIQQITETLNAEPAGSSQEERTKAFEAEVANFERLRPKLLQNHLGQFVAIRQGEVIASGDDRMAVLAAAEQKVGNVAFYVGEVTETSLRRVRMPSPRIVR